METTWATHTEYLLRSSMGTMLKLSMPSSLREFASIMYLSPAVKGLSGSWESAQDVHVAVVKWLEPPYHEGVSGVVFPGHGWPML